MWVADYADDKIYAYNLATKARDSTKDFDTLSAAGNNLPRGLWSDGTTMWVSDSSADKIYAYNLATKARDSTKDFDTLNAAGNQAPLGIYSDGITMWVSDNDDDKLYAYNLISNIITMVDLTSDGTTLWITNSNSELPYSIYAYTIATRTLDVDKSITTVVDNSGTWISLGSYNIQINDDSTIMYLRNGNESIALDMESNQLLYGYGLSRSVWPNLNTISRLPVVRANDIVTFKRSSNINSFDFHEKEAQQYSLVVGSENAITFVVTAENGVDTQVYRILITRPSAEDYLHDLSVNGISLNNQLVSLYGTRDLFLTADIPNTDLTAIISVAGRIRPTVYQILHKFTMTAGRSGSTYGYSSGNYGSVSDAML